MRAKKNASKISGDYILNLVLKTKLFFVSFFLLNLIFKVKIHDNSQLYYLLIFAVVGKVREVLEKFHSERLISIQPE